MDKLKDSRPSLWPKAIIKKKGWIIERFSPVVKMVTIRTILSVAAMEGWNIQQMDVYSAFLQRDLKE